jgi:hypothetical protein
MWVFRLGALRGKIARAAFPGEPEHSKISIYETAQSSDGTPQQPQPFPKTHTQYGLLTLIGGRKMKKQRKVYRFGLVAVIALFGYLGVSSVVDGSIRVSRVRPTEITRKENPEQFWVFTGASLVLAAAALIALTQSMATRRASPQSP